MRRLTQLLGSSAHRLGILSFQSLLGFLKGVLDIFFYAGIQVVSIFLKRFLRRIDERVKLIARFYRFFVFLVFGGMGFSIFDHLFDLILAETARRRNFNGLFFPVPRSLAAT